MLDIENNDTAVSWFDLKNGSSIGVSDAGLVYGVRSDQTGGLIDEVLQHNSTIFLEKYPDGFEMEICEAFGWVRIQKNKYRFSEIATAETFKEELLRRFPASYIKEDRPKKIAVIKEPLLAIIALFIVFMIVLEVKQKQGYSKEREGLKLLASEIPLPALIMGYLLLTLLAIYFILRLLKEFRQTTFWLIVYQK